jgi:hypothetical protein
MPNEVTAMTAHWQRFDRQTAYTGDCIVWTGTTTRTGYGQFRYNNRRVLSHRLSYCRHNGVIPDGLCIDHLCKNRSCVNPSHLEAVTLRENLLRGDTFQARNANKTHCSQGHAFDNENTRWRGNGRVCKTCNRIRSLASWRRKKARS